MRKNSPLSDIYGQTVLFFVLYSFSAAASRELFFPPFSFAPELLPILQVDKKTSDVLACDVIPSLIPLGVLIMML